MGTSRKSAPATWKQWLADREAALERVRIVDAAFGGPYRRERPRDPDEARLLRAIGTPEELIGPPAHEDDDRAELVRANRGRS
jgi:hypothetical protein